MYRVISADPPWQFGDSLPGPTRGAAKNYKVLSLDDIARFPLPSLAADCWLFLWYVTSMVDEARTVCRAWGFEPSGGEFVWVKTTGESPLVLDPLDPLSAEHVKLNVTKLAFGMGRSVRNCDERCLIAKRGKPYRSSASVRSVFFAPVGRHSEKPDRFYSLVEQLCGQGPRIEMFARKRRSGWDAMGDEI